MAKRDHEIGVGTWWGTIHVLSEFERASTRKITYCSHTFERILVSSNPAGGQTRPLANRPDKHQCDLESSSAVTRQEELRQLLGCGCSHAKNFQVAMEYLEMQVWRWLGTCYLSGSETLKVSPLESLGCYTVHMEEILRLRAVPAQNRRVRQKYGLTGSSIGINGNTIPIEQHATMLWSLCSYKPTVGNKLWHWLGR